MRRGVGAAGVLALVMALGSPAAARPDRFVLDEALTQEGFEFIVEPGRHTLVLGQQKVVFRNDGDQPHTLAERSELFEWGPIAPGEREVFEPWAAGKYRFRETNEDLYTAGAERGRFVVAPSVGPDGFGWFGQRTVIVRWATRWAPQGLVYDVKYSRGGGWRWWKEGARSPSKRFVVPNWDPNAASSCLGFKVRLRDADDPDRRLGWADSGLSCVVVDVF